MVKKIVIEILFFIVCYAIGRYQAYRFDKEQKHISHVLWAFYYCLPLAGAWFVAHNLWIIVSCGLMHIPFFNAFLNYYRTPRRALLYINAAGESFLDRTWAKVYPFVFFGSLVAIIFLQYILFK